MQIEIEKVTIYLTKDEYQRFRKVVRTAQDEINNLIRKQSGSYLFEPKELGDAQEMCEGLLEI